MGFEAGISDMLVPATSLLDHAISVVVGAALWIIRCFVYDGVQSSQTHRSSTTKHTATQP